MGFLSVIFLRERVRCMMVSVCTKCVNMGNIFFYLFLVGGFGGAMG